MIQLWLKRKNMTINKQRLVKELKNNYIKVPNRIFDIGLSPAAIALYVLYLKYSDGFHPSTPFLCKTLKLSKPTILGYKKELVERGIMIRVFKGGAGRVSKYKFTPPSSWKQAIETEKVDWK
jgi:hypothetical protein